MKERVGFISSDTHTEEEKFLRLEAQPEESINDSVANSIADSENKPLVSGTRMSS